MSLKTILASFWNGIKSLFSNLDAFKKDAVHIAVTAVEGLKTVVDSSVVDILTAIIPGDADNKLVAKARLVLPEVLVWLKLADESQLSDLPELLKTAIQNYNELAGDIKNSFSKEIATLLTRQLTEGKVSFGDSGALVEYYYKTEVKK